MHQEETEGGRLDKEGCKRRRREIRRCIQKGASEKTEGVRRWVKKGAGGYKRR